MNATGIRGSTNSSTGFYSHLLLEARHSMLRGQPMIDQWKARAPGGFGIELVIEANTELEEGNRSVWFGCSFK